MSAAARMFAVQASLSLARANCFFGFKRTWPNRQHLGDSVELVHERAAMFSHSLSCSLLSWTTLSNGIGAKAHM